MLDEEMQRAFKSKGRYTSLSQKSVKRLLWCSIKGEVSVYWARIFFLKLCSFDTTFKGSIVCEKGVGKLQVMHFFLVFAAMNEALNRFRGALTVLRLPAFDELSSRRRADRLHAAELAVTAIFNQQVHVFADRNGRVCCMCVCVC